MTRGAETSGNISYVQIDETLCNGCVLCMKACPTKAIRVEEGRVARIKGICIDCVECVRVCPRGAIKPLMAKKDKVPEAAYTAISASTALYAQFGEDVMPNDILLALRRMGFRYVHDQSYTNEMFNVAIGLYIEEGRKRPDSLWPLISPVCPAVVRLIAYRFHSLLAHIPPLLTPREIVAREAKGRLSKKYGCREEEIRVVHITPCPAKMISIKEPLLQDRSFLNDMLPLSDIHDTIKKNIRELEEDKVLHHSGGVGLGWAMSGGEIAGLDTKCLAISGLQETIHYLEKIEMGLLHDIDYVEFRICTGGCLGGPFTVVDKYLARRRLDRLIRMFGTEKRVKYSWVKDLYKKGWFFSEMPAMNHRPKLPLSSLSKGIERLNRIEEILAFLPKKECGACGSPDCRTFAEDVVAGSVTLKACVYWDQHRREVGLPPES